MSIKKIKCEYCNKQCETIDHRIHYCSEECKKAARNLRRRTQYERTKTITTEVCANPECGKVFIKKAGNQIYCCSICRRKIMRKEYKSYQSTTKPKSKPKPKPVIKYTINDIALIEKYYRVVHKITKSYGIIAAEIANGKEYNLDEIHTTLRTQETQC